MQSQVEHQLEGGVAITTTLTRLILFGVHPGMAMLAARLEKYLQCRAGYQRAVTSYEAVARTRW